MGRQLYVARAAQDQTLHQKTYCLSRQVDPTPTTRSQHSVQSDNVPQEANERVDEVEAASYFVVCHGGVHSYYEGHRLQTAGSGNATEALHQG